jgi:hypothetical protein
MDPRLASTLVLVPALVVSLVAAPLVGAAGAVAVAEPAPGGVDAGQIGLGPGADSDSESESGSGSGSSFDDPESDVVGWEAGYWHNESIDVDQSDGLSDAELDAYVGRAMARVEFVREREFEGRVPVEVIGREAYRETANETGRSNATFGAWNDQVWEALFVVGEGTTSDAALSTTRGASVAGFYSPVDDEIKIVTDTPDRPTIDNATLHHELVHALQDQYVNLTDPRYGGATQDEQLAADAVVEGEANYVERVYAERCGAEWDCVASPSRGGSGADGATPNLGVLVTILQPYSDGPVYVRTLIERGGWPAFEAAFDAPPNSTEQVIHLTNESPVPMTFEDRATGDWRPFPEQGVDGADTVGEASIYAMFWYQTRTAGADVVDPREFVRPESRFDTYDYRAAPSAGWGNDLLVPYRDGPVGAEATDYGYVWATEWDTRADAREFEAAYLDVLAAQGADVDAADGGPVYVVPEGPFADAFAVRRDGTRVTIANGPDAAAVEALRPSVATATPEFTPTATPTPTPAPAVTPGADTPTPTDGPSSVATDDGPGSPADGEEGRPGAISADGPGVVAALLAVALAVALLARRR